MDTVLSNKPFEYTGKVQPEPGSLDEKGRPRFPYYPSDTLVEAVNLAIYLKRPLLVKGEPGCGKTRLAQAVAFELGLPYRSWSIKSTSKARDGLYTYDAVGRLRKAQLATLMKDAKHIDDPTEYVTYGPLGQALKNAKRTVVLIDEIDKADIDFPNDLLLELDEKRFEIEETGQTFEAKEGAEPIIFITSNDEKDLPDAFLRRCLFHYIEFPDRARLIEIVNAHVLDVPETLANAAIDRFIKLRADMQGKGEAGKKVSTSELIDWVRVLYRYPQDEVIQKLEGRLPFAGVLLKNWDDHQRYISQTGLRTSV
jgi:MoxR-like ATPase